MSKPLSKPLSKPFSLAISTCPNDTFAFHAILERKVDLLGLEMDVQLLDIQQLNEGLFENRFDIAKASFHAAALLANQTYVLPSGSALGFGVGPLLLSAQSSSSPSTRPPDSNSLTLCPGQHTTATLLLRIFHGDAIQDGRTRLEQVLFSDIMPRLKTGRGDFGVCIHEGRFTWKQEGLHLVEDLGTRWEKETGCPLPLGGILVRRELDDGVIGRFNQVLQSSIQYGLAHRDETLTTMRKYAQEFDDDVLFGHVDLYVNEWTIELGTVGVEALQRLSAHARACGLIPEDFPDIDVWHAPTADVTKRLPSVNVSDERPPN